MILKVEIEKFIQDIEKKLPQLNDKAYDAAKEKIAVLNRINIEFMDYEDLLRKASIRISQSDIKWLDQKKINIRLTENIGRLEDELETLKKNIDG